MELVSQTEVSQKPNDPVAIALFHVIQLFNAFDNNKYLNAIDHLLKMSIDSLAELSKNSAKEFGAEDIAPIVAAAMTEFLKTENITNYRGRLFQLQKLRVAGEKVFACHGFGRICMALNFVFETFASVIAKSLHVEDSITAQNKKAMELAIEIEHTSQLNSGQEQIKTIIKILNAQLIGSPFLKLLIDNLLNYFIARTSAKFTITDLKVDFAVSKVSQTIFPTQLLEYVTSDNIKELINLTPGVLETYYKDEKYKSDIREILLSLTLPHLGEIFERLTSQDEEALLTKLAEYNSRKNIGKKHRIHSYNFISKTVIPYYREQVKSNAMSISEATYAILAILKTYLDAYLKAKKTEKERSGTLNKGKGNKFIKCLLTGINIALNFDRTSFAGTEKEIDIIKGSINTILGFIHSNTRLSALLPIIEHFIYLPIIKEHTFAAHSEKIKDEFALLFNLIQINSATDCLQFFHSFSPLIEISRKKGKTSASTDLEYSSRQLCDRLVKLFVLDPSPYKFNFNPTQIMNIFDSICNEKIISTHCVTLIRQIEVKDPKQKMEMGRALLERLFTFPTKINSQNIDVDLFFYYRAQDIGKQIIIYCYEQYSQSHTIATDKNLHAYAFAYNVRMLSNLINNLDCLQVELIPLKHIELKEISSKQLFELQIDLKRLFQDYKDYTDNTINLYSDIEKAVFLMKQVIKEDGRLMEAKRKQKNSIIAFLERTKPPQNTRSRSNSVALPTQEKEEAKSTVNAKERRNSIDSPPISPTLSAKTKKKEEKEGLSNEKVTDNMGVKLPT